MNDLVSLIRSSENKFDLYIILHKFLKASWHVCQGKIENLDKGESKKSIEFSKKLFHKDLSVIKEKLVSKLKNEEYIFVYHFLKTIETEETDDLDSYSYRNNIYEDEGLRIESGSALNTKATHILGEIYAKKDSFLNNCIRKEDSFKTDKHIGENIKSIQEKLIVVENSDSHFNRNIYKISDSYINDRLKEKNDIRIVVVPFSSEIEFQKEIIKKNGKNYFDIKKIIDHSKYYKYLDIIFTKLEEVNADIIIFPEMIFNDEMYDYTRRKIRNLKNKFLMIIGGSIWKDNQNYLYILNGAGLELTKLYKLNRFEGNGEIENLNISEKDELKIFDLNDFGRFAVPICVDYITEDYFKIIKNTGVNSCFVPAYTSSLKKFILNSENLGSSNCGSVVVSNCCTAMKNKEKKKKTFIYIPHKTSSVNYLECDGEECETCKKIYMLEASKISKEINFRTINL